MKKSFLTILAVAFIFGFTAMLGACGGGEENNDDTVVEAVDFTAVADYYANTCAACHGVKGEGGVGTAVVGDFDDAVFKKAILEGTEGTAMAAYPDADADLLIKYFKDALGK